MSDDRPPPAPSRIVPRRIVDRGLLRARLAEVLVQATPPRGVVVAPVVLLDQGDSGDHAEEVAVD